MKTKTKYDVIPVSKKTLLSDYGNEITEGGCSEGWSSEISDVIGLCPDCEHPVIDNFGGSIAAASGCCHSPETCDTCGHQPCGQYC